MYRVMTVLIVLFLSFASYCYSLINDTTPPSFTWISPEDHSIIITNTLRLCVDAHDNEGGSGIKEVKFYVMYVDFNGKSTGKKLIGVINKFPYELLWDCSEAPDHSYKRMHFFCDIIDNAGNINKSPEWPDIDWPNWPSIVLDRNPDLKNIRLLSHKTKERIIIDGNLNEWASNDSIRFANNDNNVSVYSLWNNEYLFFGIFVFDRGIVSHFPKGITERGYMPNEDVIEIYLDINHDHYEICLLPDRHFLIAPTGMVYEEFYHFDKPTDDSPDFGSDTNMTPNVESEVTINGTLNKDRDLDTNYIIELAVSWDELGVKPKNNFSIGLEIWNNDKDFVEGDQFRVGWTTHVSNLKNPSEFGDLVLVDTTNYMKIAIISFSTISCSLLLIVIIAVKNHRKKAIARLAGNEDSQGIENGDYPIGKAIKYIEEHYSDESLSRKEVAQVAGLSTPYFGALFKKETGYSFTDYLIKIRIENAKKFLLATHKTVAEITYKVGFGSQSYFAYLFKKSEKISPKEFRSKNKKSR